LTEESRGRRISRGVLAGLFVTAGVLHFVIPDFYLRIMPPWLAPDWHRELVYLSGFFEILGGASVLLPRLRRAAGWGLIALLLAVFPANIHMLQEELASQGLGIMAGVLILRLPVQFLLAWWVWRCTLARPSIVLSPETGERGQG